MGDSQDFILWAGAFEDYQELMSQYFSAEKAMA